MEIIFLGTGGSKGVPLILGDNSHLDLKNPKNWRTRSSAHIIMDGYHIQIDAGPDFRIQCLHNNIKWIDLFILTHEHADHFLGVDDLRQFCEFSPGGQLKGHATLEGINMLKTVFPYAFLGKPKVPGYVSLDCSEMPNVLEVPGGKIYSTLLPHYPLQTLGLVFEEHSTKKKIAYYSDCKLITEEAIKLAQGSEVVVLESLRDTPHKSHMAVSEALDAASKLRFKNKVYLTHLDYDLDHENLMKRLPANIEVAYDGLRVKV